MNATTGRTVDSGAGRTTRRSTNPADAAGQLCSALVDHLGPFAALLRQIRDPSPLAVGTWTIGDTARHVAGSADRILATLRGQAAPERLDEVDAENARALAADPERDPCVLAARFAQGEAALIRHAPSAATRP